MVQLGCTEFGMCIAGLTTKGWVWSAFLSDKRISKKGSSMPRRCYVRYVRCLNTPPAGRAMQCDERTRLLPRSLHKNPHSVYSMKNAAHLPLPLLPFSLQCEEGFPLPSLEDEDFPFEFPFESAQDLPFMCLPFK